MVTFFRSHIVVIPPHAEQKIVLVQDEEYEDVLGEAVVCRRHLMLRVGNQTRLEDGRQVRCWHQINVRFGGEDGKKIEDVEQQLAVERRQLADQLLVGFDRLCLIDGFVAPKRLTKTIVVIKRDDWFRELVEISPQDIGSIVNGVAGPV